ncbi:MAG: flippase-like domain-containing protein [Alphaproteobacteria bacterium]|nr:flippase-like domain-containing protein [Alphaproteobacteria bacterium]
MKPALRFLFKIIIIALLLAYVFSQTDVAAITARLERMDAIWMAAAVAALAASQLFSAQRMRHYFHAVSEKKLGFLYSGALYFLGMFYNNFLPGGIGGDGYRLIVFKREGLSAAAALRLLLSERASGLFVLCLLFAALGMMAIPGVSGLLWWAFVLALGLGYYLSTRLLLHETPFMTLGALPWSLGVQLTTLLAAFAVLRGLAVDQMLMEYLCVFLVACVLSAVIPFSVGGVGIREATFFEAARWMPIDGDTGVAFALAYFAVYLLCSLIGAPFMAKLPKNG